MVKYCLGFLFYKEFVLLIRKTKPAWQARKYNGVGGRVESHEDTWQSMVREMEEESGIETVSTQWKFVCSMAGRTADNPTEFAISVMTAEATEYQFQEPAKIAEEQCKWFEWQEQDLVLGLGFVDNLKWLIPLSKGVLQGQVQYSIARVITASHLNGGG